MNKLARPKQSLRATAYSLFVKADDQIISIPNELFEKLQDVVLLFLSHDNEWMDFNDYCDLQKVVDDINEHLLDTGQI